MKIGRRLAILMACQIDMQFLSMMSLDDSRPDPIGYTVKGFGPSVKFTGLSYREEDDWVDISFDAMKLMDKLRRESEPKGSVIVYNMV